MKQIVLILSVLVAALCAGPSGNTAETRGALDLTPVDAGEPVRFYSKSYALVIGIDGYSHWPKLSKAIEDAELVAKELRNHGFDVTLKTDLNSRALKEVVDDFIFGPGTDPDARLVIWFAGHGETIGGEGYLVPADAPDPKRKDALFRRRALSVRDFGKYMREARSKHVLAVFDSCFSGTVFASARSRQSAVVTSAMSLPVRYFISSGSANQKVSDDGTFRRLFVGAIAGTEPRADANGDKYVTGREMGLFLNNELLRLTNGKQKPRYGELRDDIYDDGDIVFALPARRKGPETSGPPVSKNGAATAVATGDPAPGPGDDRPARSSTTDASKAKAWQPQKSWSSGRIYIKRRTHAYDKPSRSAFQTARLQPGTEIMGPIEEGMAEGRRWYKYSDVAGREAYIPAGDAVLRGESTPE